MTPTKGTTRYESLTEIRDALRRAVPDQDKFDFVSIRLMLRTGINIKDPAAHHVDHPRTIKRVLEVLEALGIPH